MGKISANFKPFAEQWLVGLKSITDAAQATVRGDSKLTGDQASEARFGEHTLVSDEPRTAGGTDKGPSPLDYFMAAVGFCENVTFARYATLNGLDFDTLETSVRGHWNRRGQGDFTDLDPAFKGFIVETRVTSHDSIEKIRRVTKTTHKRCPMHSTINKVGKVVDKLFINGVEVEL
jgi:uncharacterized OsmC-like protein